MVKFSIIIPVYDVEEYLPECVESILSQTFTDYEVILIDDGSADSSGALCDQYARRHPAFQVIHQENKGQSSARNEGLKRARGEYLLFVDSDDFYFDIHCLRRISERADGCDLVAFNWTIAGQASGQPAGPQAGLAGNYANGAEYLTDVLRENPAYPWYPWPYAIRTAYWREFGFRFREGIVYEDTELIYRVLLPARRVCVISDVTYVYRQHRPRSTTNAPNARRLSNLLEAGEKNIQEVCRRQDISPELKKMLLNNFSNCYWAVFGIVDYIGDADRNIVKRQLAEKKWMFRYSTGVKSRVKAAVCRVNLSLALWLWRIWMMTKRERGCYVPD